MAGISWSASSSVVNTAGVTYAYAFSLSETTTIDTVTMTVPAGTAGTPIVGTVTPTAQICWPLLSRRAGAEVWVKHENHTPIGAFKV
ncbi:MAG: hypothetical protein JKY97_12355, partial [Citromicrobium sp.]|nr:hypothetical protein [Citromicrobium sp.]